MGGVSCPLFCLTIVNSVLKWFLTWSWKGLWLNCSIVKYFCNCCWTLPSSCIPYKGFQRHLDAQTTPTRHQKSDTIQHVHRTITRSTPCYVCVRVWSADKIFCAFPARRIQWKVTYLVMRFRAEWETDCGMRYSFFLIRL